MGVRERGARGAPAVSLPARVLRFPDARPPLRALPRAGRAGRRLSAGPAVEDLRGLGSAALRAAVVGLFLEGAVQIPEHGAPRHRALPGAEEPRAAGAGSDLLAALRGGRRVFSALRHALLLVAPRHAQVSGVHLCVDGCCELIHQPPMRLNWSYFLS